MGNSPGSRASSVLSGEKQNVLSKIAKATVGAAIFKKKVQTQTQVEGALSKEQTITYSNDSRTSQCNNPYGTHHDLYGS